MLRLACLTLALCIAEVTEATGTTSAPAVVQGDESGREEKLRLAVAEEHTEPILRIVLPDSSASSRAIEVLFSEQVTVLRRGTTEATHLYVFQPGTGSQRPDWRQVGQTLEYERELPGDLKMLARATLEPDGVRFQYEISNGSNVAYDMVYAVTDPRLTSIFHDVRLERTYVHHKDGLDLLAVETPARLTLPIDQWLSSRYLVSYTWPVPEDRVERREDGITYYNKSRAVDQPFIATISNDRSWVVASFSREVGNVWSNPELTCQHVDPQRPLTPGGTVLLEVKMLILRGSVEEAFELAI